MVIEYGLCGAVAEVVESCDGNTFRSEPEQDVRTLRKQGEVVLWRYRLCHMMIMQLG